MGKTLFFEQPTSDPSKPSKANQYLHVDPKTKELMCYYFELTNILIRLSVLDVAIKFSYLLKSILKMSLV